jgi:hypothetical protein
LVPSFVNGDLIVACDFIRVGKIGSSSIVQAATVRTEEDPTIIPWSNAVRYPKTMPAYSAASEVGAYVGDTTYTRPGSWCGHRHCC